MNEKTERFTFRATPEDRRAIEELAKQLRRTPSDAVRWLVWQALQDVQSSQSRETIVSTH